MRVLEETNQTTRTSVNRALSMNENTQAKLLETQAARRRGGRGRARAEDELRKLRLELNATKEELLPRARRTCSSRARPARSPRPDWNAIDPHGKENYEAERTLDLIHSVLDELKIFKAKADDLAKYEEAKALIEPEAEASDPFEGVAEEEETAPEKEAPAPETSDGDGDGEVAEAAPREEEGPPKLRTLGRGPELPRFLRSVDDKVLVKKLSKRDTEEFIQEVWDGKKRSDAHRKLPSRCTSIYTSTCAERRRARGGGRGWVQPHGGSAQVLLRCGRGAVP